MNKTITIELPESLTRLWKSDKELTKEMKESLILELVRKHRISFREGASLLDMEYQDFLDLMAEHNIPMTNYEPGELKKEVKTVDRIMETKR
jgi:predicted HTH domain antitoxin